MLSPETVNELKHLLTEEQLQSLFLEIDTLLKVDSLFHEEMYPFRGEESSVAQTAESVMKICLSHLAEGWQLQQPVAYQKYTEGGIDCDVRLSSISPEKRQLIAVCQGPAGKLDEMCSRVVKATESVVLDAKENEASASQ